jgi:hypothetical protein
MKRFIKRIVIFLLIGMFIGEVIAQIFTLTSDVPQRFIDHSKIQKYIPNQQGYWKGPESTHEWTINEKGWPGRLPTSYDNLITIVGDSYIENFMNPENCRQRSFLEQLQPNYNFMEASRSGVSLIEAFEIAKELDSLKPIAQFIYITDSDFQESIVQLGKLNDITQIDLDNNEVVYGKMKAPLLKKILYNWKFIFYLYNRFPIKMGAQAEEKKEEINLFEEENSATSTEVLLQYEQLLKHLKANYNLENIVFVFKPNTSIEVYEATKKNGFSTLLLDNTVDTQSWSFDYDSHWNCYGHKRAANQVSTYFKNLNL